MNWRLRGLGIGAALVVAAALSVAAAAARRPLTEAFPHDRHANVFPLCTTCHAGALVGGEPLWPEPARCAACHDGTVQPRVTWTPREGPRPGNLRFTHQAHARLASAANAADSALAGTCTTCHVAQGAPRMTVQSSVLPACFECHGIRESHVDAPAQACATCHVRLTDAPSLSRDRIAAFARPASHDDPAFLWGGHGAAATVARAPAVPGAHPPTGIAPSCATCHARNLCLECHVNAPETGVIQALMPDPRVPDYRPAHGAPPMPETHRRTDFLTRHAADARRNALTCATCHTRESCTTCHTGVEPRAVAALPQAAPGRAAGALLSRTPPPNHVAAFRERHGADAAARPATCEACHTRSTCLECHRPEAGGGRPSSFHPRNFIARHPSAAYARVANCSDCHNTAQFCQDCHKQAGLVAQSRLGRAGYHDGFRGFSLGHGQAARQSLETCVACHAERDCAACHASAVAGGFGFSPHGPGFNAARARAKNPSSCVACHGAAIPGGRQR